MMSEKIPNEDINEPKGRKLKQALKSPEQLAQLMFSALLLHWNVHASRSGRDLPSPIRRPEQTHDDATLSAGARSLTVPRTVGPDKVSLERWFEINNCIEDGIPVSLQETVYSEIASTWREKLFLNPDIAETKDKAAKGTFSQMDFASKGVVRGSVLDAYVQNPLRFAERLGHDSGAKGENTNVREVWCELLRSVLLLSLYGEALPFAFVPLERCRVDLSDQVQARIYAKEEVGSADDGVNVVFLLPDARWQCISIPEFQIGFDSTEEWKKALERVGVKT
jgi:hypothetical protein